MITRVVDILVTSPFECTCNNGMPWSMSLLCLTKPWSYEDGVLKPGPLSARDFFELPIAYSLLMCLNVITTQKRHPHGSIGMGRPAARAIWIVFSA